MRKIVFFLSATAAWFGVACSGGSSGSPSGGGGTTDGGGMATGGAQIRFKYEADWQNHLGCARLADYRITFAATPVSITFPIDPTAGAVGPYKTLDGRVYKDADVLHLYTCNGSSKQDFGRFGADLPLAASKKYTVTLGGTVATVTEDP